MKKNNEEIKAIKTEDGRYMCVYRVPNSPTSRICRKIFYGNAKKECIERAKKSLADYNLN